MTRFLRFTTGAAWFGLGITVVSLGLRFAPPVHPVGLLVAGVLPFLAIGAGAAMLLAVATTQRALAAASAMVLVSATRMIWPFDAVTDCRPLNGRSADSLVIYQANVLHGSDGGVPDRYRADILLAEADVVLLQEVSKSFAAALDDGSLAHLSHRTTSDAMMVWSRFPMIELPAWEYTGALPTLVDDGFGPIEVWSVHTAAPFSTERMQWWEAQFEGLASSMVDDRRARILGGDFNATEAHRPFRTLVGAGLTNVHDVAGCGMDATWPVSQVGPFAPPPILRLDHVLISDHFEVVGMRVGPATGEPLGSDHHPVVVELRRTELR